MCIVVQCIGKLCSCALSSGFDLGGGACKHPPQTWAVSPSYTLDSGMNAADAVPHGRGRCYGVCRPSLHCSTSCTNAPRNCAGGKYTWRCLGS